MSSFTWDFPYPSQRMPVLAKNVVATSQPLAAQAGLQALYRGGNAVDAAIAAAITLTVVEPTSNGIGSDAFIILWDGEKLVGLNASGRSPAGWTPERFQAHAAMPTLGWDAVTVPGCVSAWVSLSQRYGKLPFEQLFEAAIRYARESYMVSPITAVSWARQAENLKGFSEFSWTFLPKDRAPYPGERFYCPQMAETLEEIATTKGESFYRGALAERIALASASEGGAMSAEDLAAHECTWDEPIHVDYRGYRLHEMPPNGQGIAALIALGILENFDMAALECDSADSLHVQIEAMKLAFADIWRHLADPATMQVKAAELLDRGYLAQRAKLIDMKRAHDPVSGIPKAGGTVYLTTADERGMMVSFIQSNYMGFGSGVVVPGTGISMQNRGAGFNLKPGHPNLVGPRKRPYQTIIPGFLTRDGQPVMAFGVMGGAMQPQGHLQMILRLVDYKQNPQACSDGARWIVNPDCTVSIEDGVKPLVREELARRGHRIVSADAPMFGFGGAQLIHRHEDGYVAASDHRKDGCAIGY
ncbi:gamma-glutamyltransferase family protein [Usitatibacter palustris]|uniref:Glutathione hydrolase-like YwrD proenzyme n=1 Tax=Usitatibacter palustris TaxID=2732487 RepID=A0A6M4HC83_9PROT|nr:gamma-glutamyltransferase family protein [Usitatibacter palustris]QJR16124.1 Glutathione hydrolase-like YwrD proenzyme [Usitatibacter palustris]